MEREHRSGIWSRTLLFAAVVSLLSFPIGSLGSRFGLWYFTTGFLVLGAGLALAVVVALASLITFLLARRRDHALDQSNAQFASIICLAILMVVGYLAAAARSRPPISNISTDIQNPPEFTVIPRLRGVDANPLAYTNDLIDPQLAAYPWVRPLIVPHDPDIAFDAALFAAAEMGLLVVSEDPVRGVIEATDRTFWFGFVDDIVIRISSRREGTRIDVRSVSRVGRGDLGTNAARIQEFLSLYRQNTGLQP